MREVFRFSTAVKPDCGMRIVSPADIPLDQPTIAVFEELDFQRLVPYCIDFRAEAIFFAAGLDPRLAAGAAFHYLYLREHAREFVCIPAERLLSLPQANVAAPVLIFSPGRCGSTLLNVLLGAMGATSVSEPDFYTQAACHCAIRRSRGLSVEQGVSRMLGMASRLLLSPLLDERSRAIILKLRSDANFSPAEILASFPARPRTIFIVRGFPAWCQSRMRAFPDTLEENFAVYIMALQALRWLRANSECVCIEYEMLDADPVKTCEQLSSFLGLAAPDKDRLASVIAGDSQSGTPLARESIARQLSPAVLQGIRQLWQARAPRALLRELGLEHLAERGLG